MGEDSSLHGHTAGAHHLAIKAIAGRNSHTVASAPVLAKATPSFAVVLINLLSPLRLWGGLKAGRPRRVGRQSVIGIPNYSLCALNYGLEVLVLSNHTGVIGRGISDREPMGGAESRVIGRHIGRKEE